MSARMVRCSVGPMAATVALLMAATAAGAQSTVVVNATVYQAEGPALEGQSIIMSGGIITAVGSGIALPADAELVDAAGRLVTPGFIHSDAGLGLTEVGSVAATREGSLEGGITPAFNLLEGINPASVHIPATKMEGVTTGIDLPVGGLVPGQAVAIDLSGATIEQMLVRSPVAMVVNLTSGAKDAAGGSRAGVMAALRTMFDDALALRDREGDFEQGAMRALSADANDLAALWPVLDGELPLAVWASRESDIESALRLSEEYQLELIILGGEEAWKVADKLADSWVPVVLDPVADIPSFDAPAPRLDNAALLHHAGVPVILYTVNDGGTLTRNLRFAAGNAVRHGLPHQEAIRAITEGPARAFGLDNYGAIAEGNVANLVIWDGDPLDFSGSAARVFIRGEEIDYRSRQTELLERYRTLPPEY